MKLKKYFELEKNPSNKPLPLERIILAYMAVTLLLVLFGMTRLSHPDTMIWGRIRMGAVTLGLWTVYRLVPCRITRLIRIVGQLAMLGWWYADTYLLNTLFPNLDHQFARTEQHLFGFQPALAFAAKLPQAVVSETMNMAYAAYFPIIATVTLFYFFRRYREFERAGFIILASFFSYYLIYDLLPVTGPMYYFHAVGTEQIHRGIFPELGDYFRTHHDMMELPGYKNGLFYQLVRAVHDSGEHPTAAFPSSHVGISAVCLFLALHSRNRRLFFLVLPFFLLICLATVYIRAHYVIDVFGGILTGIIFYIFWTYVADRIRM